MPEGVPPAVGVGERPAPRRAAPRRKNRRRPDYLLIARQVAALFVGVELLHAAFASPRLAIRRVRVAGVRRVPSARISELAGVPAGRNIFHLNLAAVRERVLREPMVRDATVTRWLPGTIVIAVTERVPMLVVRSGERAWEVDDTGVAFRERPVGTDGGGRPVLFVAPGDVPAIGARLPGQRFRAALACLRLAGREHLPLRKMSFDEQGELWLNIAVPGPDGERLLPVRLGRCEELEAKVAQLPLVLPAASDDGEYLDLICATRPAYRKRGVPHSAAASESPADSSPGAGAPEPATTATSGEPLAAGDRTAGLDAIGAAAGGKSGTASPDGGHEHDGPAGAGDRSGGVGAARGN